MARILCAPDKFKGTLSAREVASAMCRGAERAERVTSRDSAGAVIADACPVADGGEGTLDVLVDALGARVRKATATGPLSAPIEARFAIGTLPGDPRAAGCVELAQAAGLVLVPVELRDPMRTTTFGVGELARHAIDAGAELVLITLGGSATVDGGCGAAQALGARFFDGDDALIEQPMTGGMLVRVARIEYACDHVPIVVACDVDNPLLGEHGAARTYAPQKGASVEQVEALERGLANLARITGGDANQRGAGSAGGAAFGLASICGAELREGTKLVLECLQFDARCRGATLVLTGEGKLDGQSLHGKACLGVARAAHTHCVPTVAIVGSTGPGADDCTNPAQGGHVRSFVSLAEEFGEARAMHEPAACIEQIAERVVRDWLSRKRLEG